MKTDLKNALRERGFRLIDLAGGIGVDKSAVTRWCQKKVPAERLFEVARFTGIPPEQIRPDLFEASEAAQ